MWCPTPDLDEHARNERGILSSLDRDITPDNPSSSHFAVFGRVLMGYRGLFVSAECQHPGGGYRIDPIAVVTRQIH